MTPYYNVRPRYTPGSPAMVDAATAARVARQEKAGYEDALSGVYGVELQTRAQNEGLRGIVERVMRERRMQRQFGFVVWDLLTAEEYWRPQRYGDGSVAEPECVEDDDHEIDPASLKLGLVCNRAVIVGQCKHCGQQGESEPMTFTFGRLM